MQISAEQLAYWYLRLNGVLNIPNFVVHPDTGNEQRTDVDVLGVRFPYRKELLVNSMVDDELFRRVRDKTYVVLAEVKTGICNLNGPWTIRERQNMQRVLRAVGTFPQAEVEIAAASLYDAGFYSNQLYYASLFCFGAQENQNIRETYPRVPQVTWNHALNFIYSRFRKYRNPKSSHGQWTLEGRELWDSAMGNRTVEDFINDVRFVA